MKLFMQIKICLKNL